MSQEESTVTDETLVDEQTALTGQEQEVQSQETGLSDELTNALKDSGVSFGEEESDQEGDDGQEQEQEQEEEYVAPEVSTGNTALDIAITQFFESTKCTEETLDSIFEEVISSGDTSKLNEAKIMEQFGDKQGKVALQLAKAYIENVQKEESATKDVVYSIAGDEATWLKAADVFKNKAPESLHKYVSQQIDSGDMELIKLATQQVIDFASKSGVIVKKGTKVSSSSNSGVVHGLSNEEYIKAAGKLKTNSKTYNADISKLMELRRLGRQLGR